MSGFSESGDPVVSELLDADAVQAATQTVGGQR